MWKKGNNSSFMYNNGKIYCWDTTPATTFIYPRLIDVNFSISIRIISRYSTVDIMSLWFFAFLIVQLNKKHEDDHISCSNTTCTYTEYTCIIFSNERKVIDIIIYQGCSVVIKSSLVGGPQLQIKVLPSVVVHQHSIV